MPDARASRSQGSEARSLGFLGGVAALFEGALFIAQRPRSWPAAAVPLVIAAFIASGLLWISFDWAGPALSQWLLPEAESWYARALKGAVRWIASIVAAYASILLSAILTPPLSAPALEHLVRLQEHELQAPPRPDRGSWFELRAELEAQFVAFALAAPISLAVWVLSLMFPPLLPLLAPIHLALASLVVAWNLLGYPLTLRGVRVRARLAAMRRNALGVLGFGAAFAVLSLVPGAALVMLPAGVVGATRLVHRMQPRVDAAPHRPGGHSDEQR